MGSVKLMKASAGSGKTYQLAYEYVRSVIAEPMEYRHILAVTFTNKATEEMKSRILQEINDLAVGGESSYLQMLESELKLNPRQIAERAKLARTKILHDYSYFAILTIDKFFQRIIRSFIKELGIDLNFNLELQTDSLLASAADELIDNISTNEDLKNWIINFVEERIEDNQQWDIRRGLIELGSEVFSERYKRAERRLSSKDELAKIVGELSGQAFTIKNSLQKMGQQALDIIHSGGLSVSDFAYGRGSFANHFAKLAEGVIEPYGARVVNALNSDESWYTKSSPRKADIIATIPQLRPLLEQVTSIYDASLHFLNSVDLLRENYRNFALLNDLSQKIDDICSEENIMPISQTNEILYKLISGNDTPFIFEKVGNHYTRFMIDEFQDTSTMQWENFVPLLHNALAQSDKAPVLLVGDVKQSIYRWRGGDWRILAHQIESEFEKVIEKDLTTNYRSLRNVVEFNNTLIAECVESDNELLNAELDSALENRLISNEVHDRLHNMLQSAYENHSQESRYEEREGYVNVTYYDKNEDGDYIPPVIEHIEQLQEQGYAPGEIAILVRYNADGTRLANMLLEYKGQNPDSKYSYDVVTQEALTIGLSPVILFIVACMKLSANREDSLSRAVYNNYKGFPLDKEFDASEIEYLNSIQFKTPEEAFESLVMEHQLNKDKPNIAYLQAFHEQIISFSSLRISDIELFITWWEENGAKQSVNVPQGQSAINIITIHKAKGLQYKAVIIPYCNWSLTPYWKTIVWADGITDEFQKLGELPIRFKSSMGESYFAEDYFNELVLSHVDNINTFYVAATRAEEQLHIMMPLNSTTHSARISRLISDSIQTTDSAAQLGALNGEYSIKGVDNVIEFGDPLYKTEAHTATEEKSIDSDFGTFKISDRLKLRFNTERYLDDGVTDYTMSPRHYGLLMHRVFEGAKGIADVERSLNKLMLNGIISESEERQLSKTISQAFDNELIKSWFDDSWEVVRNENDIIIPPHPTKDGTTRRPDRVMIKGESAVIVDYKFGLNRLPAHSRQVRDYASLLKQMGYKKVDGYIWYVSMDDVEPVVLSQ